MGERRIDITDDRGIFGNIVAHAYIDDESNGIIVTDDSRGPLGNKIIGRGYIESDHPSIRGIGDGSFAVLYVTICVILLAVVGTLAAIPTTWYYLVKDFSEDTLECMFMLLVAGLTLRSAYKNGFKKGIQTSILVGGTGILLICWNDLHGFIEHLGVMVALPFIMTGFGFVPAAIGKAVKDFSK